MRQLVSILYLSALAAAQCPSSYNLEGSKCYKVTAAQPDWNLGRQVCLADAADLAAITNDSEAAAVTAICRGAWTGLNDLAAEGIWTWAGGASTAYIQSPAGQSLWSSGQPDNYLGQDCVAVTADGNLDDFACTLSHPACCEFVPSPSPTATSTPSKSTTPSRTPSRSITPSNSKTTSPSPSPGFVLLADQVADFSPVQNVNGWSWGYYTGTDRILYTSAEYNDANGLFQYAGESYCRIGSGFMHPNTGGVCSTASYGFCKPSILWTNPETTLRDQYKITFTGYSAHSCEDGITVTLKVNGITEFADSNNAGGPLNSDISIITAESPNTIELISDPLATCNCDGLTLTLKVYGWPIATSPTPTPTISDSPSVSPSSSVSASATVSTTVTGSQTPSLSTSPTRTATPTATLGTQGPLKDFVCEGTQTVDYGANYRTTPAGANYVDNFACTTYFTCPPGRALRLTVLSTATEPCCDFFTVYDGIGTGGTQLMRISGSTVPGPVFSTGQALTVVFTTDISIVNVGVAARIEFVDVSPSPSPSRTPSQTASATVSSSVTKSLTVTPSVTPSSSPSNSPSTSLSPSTSVSASVSVTGSGTRTPTMSRTLTVTPTESTSSSASISSSMSPSTSVSTSVSPSESPSSTPGKSWSVTATITSSSSVSPSSSRSASETPSISISPSTSGSTSVTPTTTITGSMTRTPRFSPSTTRSTTATTSLSSSLSPSISVTPTVTWTPGRSRTPSATRTASRSITKSVSPTKSQTVSTTPSQTISSSPSYSPTETATISGSSSISGSPSVTTSPTISVSVSPSSSQTATISLSITTSPSASASATASISTSISASPSASASATASISTSISASPSTTISNSNSPAKTTSSTSTASASTTLSVSSSPISAVDAIFSIPLTGFTEDTVTNLLTNFGDTPPPLDRLAAGFFATNPDATNATFTSGNLTLSLSRLDSAAPLAIGGAVIPPLPAVPDGSVAYAAVQPFSASVAAAANLTGVSKSIGISGPDGSEVIVRNLAIPILIVFPEPDSNASLLECSFYNVTEAAWSTAGCTGTPPNCFCNHMTEFGLRFRAIAATNEGIIGSIGQLFTAEGIAAALPIILLLTAIGGSMFFLLCVLQCLDRRAFRLYAVALDSSAELELLRSKIIEQASGESWDRLIVQRRTAVLRPGLQVPKRQTLPTGWRGLIRLWLTRFPVQHPWLGLFTRFNPMQPRIYRLLLITCSILTSVSISILFYGYSHGAVGDTSLPKATLAETLILSLITTAVSMPVGKVLTVMSQASGKAEFSARYPYLSAELYKIRRFLSIAKRLDQHSLHVELADFERRLSGGQSSNIYADPTIDFDTGSTSTVGPDAIASTLAQDTGTTIGLAALFTCLCSRQARQALCPSRQTRFRRGVLQYIKKYTHVHSFRSAAGRLCGPAWLPIHTPLSTLLTVLLVAWMGGCCIYILGFTGYQSVETTFSVFTAVAVSQATANLIVNPLLQFLDLFLPFWRERHNGPEEAIFYPLEVYLYKVETEFVAQSCIAPCVGGLRPVIVAPPALLMKKVEPPISEEAQRTEARLANLFWTID